MCTCSTHTRGALSACRMQTDRKWESMTIIMATAWAKTVCNSQRTSM